MKLSKDDILHIAELSRLRLSENEVTRFQLQLSEILDYFDMLKEVDTENIPPTASVLQSIPIMREDECTASISREDIQKNISLTEDGYIKTTKII